MIFDRIETFDPSFLPPRFQKALAYMKALKGEPPKGRNEIDGDALYMNVMEYDADVTDRIAPELEAHRKYADIQFVLSGAEAVVCESVAGLETSVPYKDADDVLFFRASGKDQTKVQLTPGLFAVFFPGDGHYGRFAPVSGPAKGIRKAVIKVLL